MTPEHMGASQSQSRGRSFAATAASSAAGKMFLASIGVLLVLADAQATSSPTPAPSVQETCSNGVPGVEHVGGDVCCPALCGDVCGGTGCDDLGRENCCSGDILDSGIYCEDSGAAPCIIGAQDTCSNGVPGVEHVGGEVCCPALCGDVCGGTGCDDLGRENCCFGDILDSGIFCEDSGAAPCIIGDAQISSSPTPAPSDAITSSSPTPAPFGVQETCTNGVPGIENNMGTVCCPTAVCGDVCGGTSCEDVDHENCCSGGIEESGIYCDDSGTAPCIIIIDAQSSSSPTPAPSVQETCRNGVLGVENLMGTVCCPLLCGDKCGGTGCGPVSYENCCAGGIVDSDIFCEDSETAPCIIGFPTPAPTPAPVVTPAPAVILLTTTPSPTEGGAETTNATSSSSSQGIATTPSPTVPPPSYDDGSRGVPLASASTSSPSSSSSSAESVVTKDELVPMSFVGGLLLAVLLVTCSGLKSHCSSHGKSILRSLETLFAKGSFWGANFVLFGLLLALNIYNFSTLWGAVGVFGTVVLWVVVFAWFVAFKTGTPATISLGCPCRIPPCKPSAQPTELPDPRPPTCPNASDDDEEAPYYGAVVGAPSADLEFSHVNPDPRARRAT